MHVRKSLALIFAFIFLLSSFALAVKPASGDVSAENSWITRTPMHQARGGLGVAVVDSKIYAIGGYNGSGPFLTTNEEYNPATDTWAFKKPLPTPMAYFGIAVYQDKIYCISGENGATQVYTPQTDTWETGASLPHPREGITANAVGGKIYVVGGKSDITDVYDPTTDLWTTKTSVPVAPDLNWGWSCTSVVLNHEIHIIGALPPGSHQIYNPFTDTWRTPITSGYSFTWFACAGATTGVDSFKRIYVFGGDRRWWGNGVVYILTQSYDSENGTWSQGASMPTGRLEAGVAVIDDVVYVIGGFTPWLGSNWAASTANEQYLPFGYVKPVPSNLFPTDSQPAQSPTFNQTSSSLHSTAIEADIVLVTAGTVLAIVIAVAVLKIKRKKPN